MKCEEFRQNWTDWHEGWIDPGHEGMRLHRDRCAACARYDRQMKMLVGALSRLPLPAAEGCPASDTAAMHTARGAASAWSAWSAGPRWAALAATLVIGVVLGVLLGDRLGTDDQAIMAEPVALSGPGDHRIAVAFDSPRSIDHVQFVVELPAGVELIGFPDQRVVRWDGRLAEGRSRLQLPLHLSAGATDGELIARIVHNGGERRLIVPLDTNPNGNAGAVALDTHSA